MQTNCPKCKAVVESPFLNKLRSVKCPQCQAIVTVDDVTVASKGFTVCHEDLQNRIARYELLLREVETERTLMAQDQSVPKETNHSFDQFCSTLKELLKDARSHFRLKMTRDIYLQMDSGDNKCKVKLIDISTAGASIECETSENLARPKAMINLTMTLPKLHEPVSLLAKVVWARKLTPEAGSESCRIGVKFANLDEKNRTAIWDFINEGAR